MHNIWCQLTQISERQRDPCVSVVFELSVHTRPIQQLHGSFITLVTHLVMKSCYDIRWKGSGQNQLLEDTMSLVCLSAVENPSLRNKCECYCTNIHIGGSLLTVGLAGYAAMTGPMIGPVFVLCSSCRLAMDNLGRLCCSSFVCLFSFVCWLHRTIGVS